MSTVPARPAVASPLLLHGVDWRTYIRLLHVFAEHPKVRMTYDRGRLELMSPLFVHETDGGFLGTMVEALTDELGLPRKTGGSTTLRRRRYLKGLEPDRCYWIANEAAVRTKKRLDLRVDPPPDLAIECDVTNRSIDRMPIYAALGVPELWRLQGQILAFHRLVAGAYTPVGQSLSFPLVTPADLMGFMNLRSTLDETSVIRQFRAWVRQRLAAPPPP